MLDTHEATGSSPVPPIFSAWQKNESSRKRYFESRTIHTTMDILEAIKSRRSIRRFSQEKLDRNFLIELIETARCAPAGANVQSLEYIIVDDASVCEKVFDTLAWAGHVRPKRNPQPGQRPVAYIVVISDTEIKKEAHVDAAAAIENILLAAWSKGIGSCWLGSIDRIKLLEILNIGEKYQIDSVIALGRPAEKPVMEDAATENAKYYLDGNDVLHVPKRPLKKILSFNKFGSK
jgi:nitroreductase